MNDGGPAFPITQTPPTMFGHEIIPGMAGKEGMTLRDYFAAKAMPPVYLGWEDGVMEQTAKEAYRFADFMLKAREAR